MSRIAMETEKLLGYCVSTGVERLTDEIVDSLVYPDTEYKKYELSNALARKNYSAFMKILKDLLAHGYNETELLSTLASYFKTLYEVSISRGSDGDIATALGLKEYAVKKNREQAAKFTKEEILEYYNTVFNAISALKCGEITPSGALKAITAKLFFKG
jgi:DNA polymerase III delta subunit